MKQFFTDLSFVYKQVGLGMMQPVSLRYNKKFKLLFMCSINQVSYSVSVSHIAWICFNHLNNRMVAGYSVLYKLIITLVGGWVRG